MMMTQKQILRNLITSISSELQIFDFMSSIGDQGFIRRTEESVFFFHLIVNNRTSIKTGAKGFLIEPFIYVNVKRIEKYYKEITINTALKEDINFVTIGNSVAALLANPDGLYKHRNKSLDLLIFNENDIYLGTEILIKKFKEVVLPYCLQNSNIAAVDKLANNHPREYKVNFPNDNYRIIKGLIAAKLNNNPCLEELIDIYDRQLIERDMADDTREEVMRVKAILPSMT